MSVQLAKSLKKVALNKAIFYELVNLSTDQCEYY